MTISDDLAKWEARSRSTDAGLRNSVPVTQIIGELRDARRKLAAVETLCAESEAQHRRIWDEMEDYVDIGHPKGPYPGNPQMSVVHVRAALAAGEAPTEPATCDMRGGEVYDFAWCETHDTTFALGDTCPGPVPQGGTE